MTTKAIASETLGKKESQVVNLPTTPAAKLPVATLEETINEKIAQVCELHANVQRLETLRETRRELATFKASNNGLNATLRLSDVNGQTFSTTNSEAIAVLVEDLKKILDEKIKATEALILA